MRDVVDVEVQDESVGWNLIRGLEKRPVSNNVYIIRRLEDTNLLHANPHHRPA